MTNLIMVTIAPANNHTRHQECESRRPKNWRGSAKRDATHHTATVVYIILSITCSENVHERSCITVDRDNNETPAIIIRQEYYHSNEK